MTIKKWLELLPDGVRERALHNLRADRMLDDSPTMSRAIDEAFTWSTSSEGEDFWSQLYSASLCASDEMLEKMERFYKQWREDNEQC
jgi:hypothetical protein